MEELKPCPFCGGKAIIRSITSWARHNKRCMKYDICCNNCSVYGFCFETKAIFEENGKITVDETERTEAIEKWNRRYKDEQN